MKPTLEKGDGKPAKEGKLISFPENRERKVLPTYRASSPIELISIGGTMTDIKSYLSDILSQEAANDSYV